MLKKHHWDEFIHHEEVDQVIMNKWLSSEIFPEEDRICPLKNCQTNDTKRTKPLTFASFHELKRHLLSHLTLQDQTHRDDAVKTQAMVSILVNMIPQVYKKDGIYKAQCNICYLKLRSKEKEAACRAIVKRHLILNHYQSQLRNHSLIDSVLLNSLLNVSFSQKVRCPFKGCLKKAPKKHIASHCILKESSD